MNSKRLNAPVGEFSREVTDAMVEGRVILAIVAYKRMPADMRELSRIKVMRRKALAYKVNDRQGMCLDRAR